MSTSKTLWHLFYIFFKAGTFTFAGGLAMLPVIQEDLVNKYQMMDEDVFIEYATLAQTLPGVIALNCATFVGKHVAGKLGMLVAGLGSTISAFFLMVFATIMLQQVPASGWVSGAFHGIRIASSAFILSAAYTLGTYNIKEAWHVILMLVAFVSIVFFDVSAPLVVLGAAIIGMLIEKYRRSY